MIEALDETIKQLLVEKTPLNLAEVDISFDVPNREWSGAISKPTINIYLYDIRENLHYTPPQGEWQIERGPNGRIVKNKPGTRYDLSYLITAWTTNTEDEHRLLWYVLATLARYTYLPRDVLQKPLEEQPYPMQTTVAHPDGILKNVADVWTALDNQLKPVLPYVVTIFMGSSVSLEAPMVRSKFIRYQPPETDLEAQQRALEISSDRAAGTIRHLQVGGFVTDATNQDKPVKAEVVLVEQGLNVRTDAQGRYSFNNLAERPKYTFLVVAPGYVTARQELTIPAASYDFKLQPEK